MILKNKTGAMEMSVGTIVTIVLLMTVLILGLILVKNIFSSAKGVIDLTTSQLEDEVNKLFGEDKELVIYPRTRFLEIKQGETDGVGIGIKNLLSGVAGTKKFSYEVIVSDSSDCTESKEEVETWFKTGRSESDIPIPVGSIAIQKVLFNIPIGSSLCTVRFRVNVDAEGSAYATDFFDIEVKPK